MIVTSIDEIKTKLSPRATLLGMMKRNEHENIIKFLDNDDKLWEYFSSLYVYDHHIVGDPQLMDPIITSHEKYSINLIANPYLILHKEQRHLWYGKVKDYTIYMAFKNNIETLLEDYICLFEFLSRQFPEINAYKKEYKSKEAYIKAFRSTCEYDIADVAYSLVKSPPTCRSLACYTNMVKSPNVHMTFKDLYLDEVIEGNSITFNIFQDGARYRATLITNKPMRWIRSVLRRYA